MFTADGKLQITHPANLKAVEYLADLINKEGGIKGRFFRNKLDASLAFYNTDLETILRCLKIETLVIAGVMTNMCCESTARDAYYRDYKVFIPADAAKGAAPAAAPKK